MASLAGSPQEAAKFVGCGLGFVVLVGFWLILPFDSV